jgi:putative acetyltransferase
MQTLESDRLVLRNFTELDTDDLFRYASDPEVGPPAGWKPHETRAESLAIIRMFLSEDNVWAIERKSDRRVIGSLGLHTDKWRNLPDVRTFGYVLSRDCWGRGYMSEAVKRASEYAFTEANLRLLSVSHYTFNDRSRRVIEKCGFVREGVLRSAFLRYDGQLFDEAIYSLTRQEWLAHRTQGANQAD